MSRLDLAFTAELAKDLADGAAPDKRALRRDPSLIPTTVRRIIGARENVNAPLPFRPRPKRQGEGNSCMFTTSASICPEPMPPVTELPASEPSLVGIAVSRLRLRGDREMQIGPLAALDAGAVSPPLAEIVAIVGRSGSLELATHLYGWQARQREALSAPLSPAIAAQC